MTIPKLTPYTGQVANPDGSQTQTEFTQNMFGQLSYEVQLATELDATIDGMNQAVTDVENSAAEASASATSAEAAASTAGYQGLWPDTGGSAEKGDTYQTQVGGTPTGDYYTALQNTTVDPVGDNVNWKRQVSKKDVDARVFNFATLDDAINSSDLLSGASVNLKERVAANGGGATWDVVLVSSVTPDSFSIVQCTGVPTLALVLRVGDVVDVKQFGASGNGIGNDQPALQAAMDFAESSNKKIVFFPKGDYAIANKCILPGGIKYIGSGGSSSKIVKHLDFVTNNPNGDVMWVNKGWDTATGFNAAANGVIHDLAFDEGNPTQPFGDAIALGHASNWLVERCTFFAMKFHGVDVTGSKTVTVRDCKYFGVVGQSENAFQADQATTNAIKGINADDTGSENVKFLNNYVTGASVDSLGPQSSAFHIHRSKNKNILIDGNYIENCDFLVQTDSGSVNESVIITNNQCLRGTVDGASASMIKSRGVIKDCIIKGNRTFGYNVDVQFDHPTTADFNVDLIIADNSFNFAVNRSIVVQQAFRVNVHDNVIEGASGDMVDAAIAMLGCNNFNVHDNNIYDPNGDGIVVDADGGGGASANGLIHSNQILNGDTGLICSANASDVLFYNNRLNGTFATAETNINQNLSDVRDLGFHAKEHTVTLAEAGRTINAGATDQINVTINGAIQGDMVLVGYDKDTQGLQIYGNMYGFQAGRIYLYNPTGGNITLAAGNWKVIAKSSRFIS